MVDGDEDGDNGANKTRQQEMHANGNWAVAVDPDGDDTA